MAGADKTNEIIVDEQYPSFELRSVGLLWFGVRFDRLSSGSVSYQVLGKPSFLSARARVPVLVLQGRRDALWGQVEEVRSQITPEDSPEKTARLADRLGDLMARLTVLGTGNDVLKGHRDG